MRQKFAAEARGQERGDTDKSNSDQRDNDAVIERKTQNRFVNAV
jgi:hypothetical protein